MSFSIAGFITRKRGLTPAAFKTHYEDIHLPLLQDLFGPTFPISYSRWYIPQTATDNPSSDGSDPKSGPIVVLGAANGFSYDLLVELVFEDEKAFKAFEERSKDPELAAKIKEDDDSFIETEKALGVVIDRPIVLGELGK